MSNMQFACSKIRILQGKSIQKTDIDRLLDANTYDDAKQVLVDLGIIPSKNDDYELYLDKILEKACMNIFKYCDDSNLRTALLIQYDAHNLKMLFKARILGIDADFLYNVGIYRVEEIRRYITNHNYSHLPMQLKNAMNKLETLIIKEFVPYLIDTIIDKACFSYITELISNLNNPLLSKYFTKRVVFANTIMVQRLKNMGKIPELLSDMLLDSDAVDNNLFVKAYTSPSTFFSAIYKIDRGFAREYERFISNYITLSDLEKAADNALLATFKTTEYNLIDINNFILYLLKLQRSLLAVRLIMSVKAAGKSEDEIRERLRDMNAR